MLDTAGTSGITASAQAALPDLKAIIPQEEIYSGHRYTEAFDAAFAFSASFLDAATDTQTLFDIAAEACEKLEVDERDRGARPEQEPNMQELVDTLFTAKVTFESGEQIIF